MRIDGDSEKHISSRVERLIYLSLHSTREYVTDGAMIQEGGRALVWSLVRKACGDTTGVKRKMLSGMKTTSK